MMNPPALSGCIPIVCTPFHDDGRLDEASLRREVDYLISAGVHGLAALAIASEGYKLNDAERAQVVQIVIEAAGGRVPVVIAADHSGTDVALERARAAAEAGADALMVLPPYFIKPDADNLYRYYQRLAQAVTIPLIVQDAPQLTGVTMSAAFLAQLNRDFPTISHAKLEGTPAGPKTSEVIRLTAGRMGLHAGWGGLSFWDGLQRGACGCMPAPNFAPALAQVYNRYTTGQPDAALALFNRLVPFITWSMQSVDLSVWAAKETFRRMGIFGSAYQREPAALPDDVTRGQFDAFMHSNENGAGHGMQ
ncbi:MAG: dihydrodipicolinate synthase family protein [Anaerolineae bacterium]